MLSRLLCLLLRRHGRTPRWGGARPHEPQADVVCGRCGSTTIQSAPLIDTGSGWMVDAGRIRSHG